MFQLVPSSPVGLVVETTVNGCCSPKRLLFRHEAIYCFGRLVLIIYIGSGGVGGIVASLSVRQLMYHCAVGRELHSCSYNRAAAAAAA